MILINNFSYSYAEGKKAVDDISLTIADGEIFGFIGHNGAGKSTTIKAIVGILDFKDGDIIINGKSVKSNAIECKSELAYLPDNPDLYDFMSGIKYLNFIGDIFKVPSDVRDERIHKYAELFEIEKVLADAISSYSHGMKQKLAIISALIHNPKVLVMDEPFVGLDPKASFQVKEIMRELCANGTSIFFSSHVLEVVEKLCDKVAIIQNGKIVKMGTVDEVKGDESLEDIFLELTDHE